MLVLISSSFPLQYAYCPTLCQCVCNCKATNPNNIHFSMIQLASHQCKSVTRWACISNKCVLQRWISAGLRHKRNLCNIGPCVSYYCCPYSWGLNNKCPNGRTGVNIFTLSRGCSVKYFSLLLAYSSLLMRKLKKENK